MPNPLILTENGPPLRSWLRLTPDALPGGEEAPAPADGLLVDLSGLDGDAAVQGRARLAAWRRGAGASAPLVVGLHRLEDEDENEADLGCAVEAGAEAVTAPGLGTRASLQHLDSLLSSAEALAGGTLGSTATLSMFGADAGALLTAGTCAGASARLRALAFDGTAAARAGGAVVADGDVVRTARGLVLLAAAAAGVSPLVMIHGAMDRDTLYGACLDARRQGFFGVITDRPEALPVIHEVFAPLL